MSRDALAVAFEAGASEELTGILRDLADATGPRGPRYAPQVIRRLSRMVAARSYGTALLELVHLLRAAEHVAARGGWPSLFWEDDDVSAAGFATRFDRLGLATARQSGGALSLTLCRRRHLSSIRVIPSRSGSQGCRFWPGCWICLCP